MNNFDGRVAAITGAGSGIGRALALQLSGRGCSLALADINGDSLEETAAMVRGSGGRCSTRVLDVAERAAVEAWAAEVVDEYGEVNMLFNNAGTTVLSSVEDTSIEDYEWLMGINFWGVIYGCKAFLPHLKRADEAHIVNVSSLFGLMSIPGQSAYHASKFAVRGFTESLKMELAGTTVSVSCVHPGGIRTGIARGARMPGGGAEQDREEVAGRFEAIARTEPEEAAAIILRGVEKQRRRILVGWDARLADWLVRLFPARYEKLLGLEGPRGVARQVAQVENAASE